MREHAISEDMPTDLRAHPAVKAWSELQPERVEPESIEILRAKEKSVVYRLEGVGPGGNAIIAKYCCQTNGVIERTIYEEVLLHLPITALHYYGFVEASDRRFCWLFLEDAGGQKYSPLIEEHRTLAAQWLGLMHTSAAHVAVADRLPDRGPGHFLEHLQSGRAKILRNLANPALKVDDLKTLQSIVLQYEVLESRWHQVEGFCAGLPRTLVHGDFTRKNLRVRFGQAGIALLPFDWEFAGWGIPAPDLAPSALLGSGDFSANPDIVIYWSVVRDHWPSLDLETMQRLANYGEVFWCLAPFNWAGQWLAYEETELVVSDMRIYQAALSISIH